MLCTLISSFFFFNDTATTEIYTLSLHDALPISRPTIWSCAECRCGRLSSSTSSSRACACSRDRPSLPTLAISFSSSASPRWPDSQRESCVTSSCSGFMDVRGQEQVFADGVRRQAEESHRLGQVAEEARAASAHDGGNEDKQLVDEVLPEEGGRERRPALEQQRLDALLPEPRELLSERPRAKLELGPFGKRATAERQSARLAPHFHVARRQRRIVGANRPHPDRDRVGGRPQLVDQASALLAGDPARARHRHAAVERDRDLVRHERPPLRDRGAPRLVLLPRLERVDELCLDTCGAQLLEAASVLRMRVERAGDDARDPGLEQSVDARRRAAVMGARLLRHVQRCSSRPLAGGGDRVHLRVWPAVALVPALADHLPVADEHGPDDRVRVRRAAAAFGQLQRSFQAHWISATSASYAATGSSAPNTLEPATNRLTPASRSSRAFSTPTPPSTWTWRSGGISSRSLRIRGIASGMNACPEYPGWMLMQLTMSAASDAAAASSGLVSGLNASPTARPWARAWA